MCTTIQSHSKRMCTNLFCNGLMSFPDNFTVRMWKPSSHLIRQFIQTPCWSSQFRFLILGWDYLLLERLEIGTLYSTTIGPCLTKSCLNSLRQVIEAGDCWGLFESVQMRYKKLWQTRRELRIKCRYTQHVLSPIVYQWYQVLACRRYPRNWKSE